MKLNPVLKDFWKTQKQIKVLYGGRMSSKTEDTAGVLSFIASRYKVRIACLRRFQNRIDESVYSVLKKKIENDEELNQLFDINMTTIRSKIGSKFIFLGTQTNLSEIKGLDDIDITWIEEAEKITQEQWDVIRPTILRKDNSFCIFIFNPQLMTDYVYKEFVLKEHDNVLVQMINYPDNPFLSNSALSLIESDRKNLSEDEFNHLYLGYPREDSEESIIKRSWVDACVDAHIKLGISPSGSHKLGFDIADDGNDTNATVLTYGVLAIEIKEWKAKEDELMESSLKAFNQAIEHDAVIQYDCIGVGASAGSHFKNFNATMGKSVKFIKFDAGGTILKPEKEYQYKVKNKDYFLNLKAQAWWNVADRMKATYNAISKGENYDPENIISISSDIKQLYALKEQLCIPKKDHNPQYKNKVESKDDLRKRGISSPNLADAFIMAYADLKVSGFFA